MDYAWVDEEGVVLNIGRFDDEATAIKMGYTVRVHHDDNTKEVGRGWVTKDKGQTWDNQTHNYDHIELRKRMSKKLGFTIGIYNAKRLK